MGSLTTLLDVQLKLIANKINTATLHQKNMHLLNFLPQPNHYNYKLDKNILKTLIQRNKLPTDPNKK